MSTTQLVRSSSQLAETLTQLSAKLSGARCPTDERAARAELREALDRAELQDRSAEDVSKLIENYLGYLRVKRGRSRHPRHMGEVERRVRRMLEGVSSLAEVTPQSIEARMVELLEEVVRIRGQLRRRTTQTIDGHRRELGTFFRWAVRAGHLDRNPVDKTERFDAEDAKWTSRPFTPEEAALFFAHCDRRRLVVYLFWATTGLRAGETGRSRMSQLVLDPRDGSPPHLAVLRATSKNHRAMNQPLHPHVVDLLRARPPRSQDAPLFDRLPDCEEFLGDLKRAGLYDRRVTSEGTLSRTSLRKLFATEIDRLGATEGQCQKLMRHSTPELTRRVYTHHELSEKSAIVARLSFLPAALVACPS